MKKSIMTAEDRAELYDLVVTNQTKGIKKVRSAIVDIALRQSLNAVFEFEHIVGHLNYAENETSNPFGLFNRKKILIEPVDALVLMFNRNGYRREQSMNLLREIPDSQFFVAALVSRMNDWVEPVRRAAEECAKRCLPNVSAKTLIGTLPFVFGRAINWKRWIGMPEIILTSLSRPDCVAELAKQIQSTNEVSASVLRTALRFGLLEKQIIELSSKAKRPENRAILLKAILDDEITWVGGYEQKWVDKTYGIKKRVTIFGCRELHLQVSKEFFVEQAARDASAMVRRIAAQAIIDHSAKLSNLEFLVTKFNEEKSKSILERIDYIKRNYMNIPNA
jgi:hypothetical protein